MTSAPSRNLWFGHRVFDLCLMQTPLPSLKVVQLFRFFAIPQQRTFVRPKTFLITPKACSTLARTRDLARIYSACLLNVIAAPAMMPWTVADQSTEMSRQVTLIGKPYSGRDIDQVHIGEDK
jgi:hypothetical protein